MLPISVIVSVYNRLDCLRKALISIASQSVTPSEVIICDDGSSEPTVASLKTMVSEVPFSIRVVRQEDRGFRLARSKNNGIRLATNDFLVFWDQDLVGTRGYLETYWNNRKHGRFVVAYPVRLTPEQTEMVSETRIRSGKFGDILASEQIAQIRRQHRKDMFYYYVRKILGRKYARPKLRGGSFAAFKCDLIEVNGFDENYQGWGNEDDDLGRRLYAIGVVGYNPFCDEFPLHMYHPEYHDDGMRVNLDYHRRRQKEINQGKIRPCFGLDNPSGEDQPTAIDL